MTYSNPLDPATPSDLAPVGQGDDRIRETKAAIIERLLTLITDVDADPWVLKAGVVSLNTQLADNIVDQRVLALLSVGTPELIDLAVTNPKIADDTILSAKVKDVGGTDKLLKGIKGQVNIPAVTIAAGAYLGYVATGILGAAVDDVVVVGRNINGLGTAWLDSKLIVTGRVTATNLVGVELYNPTAAAVAITAGLYNFVVLKSVG